MGRYYSGDIEGKFWFAVQSSTTAGDRFGLEECIPDVVEYNGDESNLPRINEELKRIEDKMGEQLTKYKEFFANVNGYSEATLKEAGLDPAFLEDYADYGFGIQIRDCIMEQGNCYFTAEL